MNFISLFSGIGGFEVGLERAGATCVCQVERDDTCLSVLARHWPNVRRIDEVTKARMYAETKASKRISAGPLVRPDILCGGFPCQDLSVAGKRAGLAGNRSGLFWTMRRIIALLRPAWILLENVPGLLSSNKGRDMGAILAALGDIGYGWAYRVLDAQYFGLAQRRKRVFIVGYSGGLERCLGAGELRERSRLSKVAASVLFEPDSVFWDHPPSRKTGEKIAGTISGGAHPCGLNGRDAENGTGCVVTSSIVSNGDAHSGFRDEKGLVQSFAPSSIGDYKEGVGTLRAHGEDRGGGSECLILSRGLL